VLLLLTPAAAALLLLPQDFIMRLLERKPAKRLGMLAGKAADVKRHRWFDGFDWVGLESRRATPPRKPKVRVDASCLHSSCVFVTGVDVCFMKRVELWHLGCVIVRMTPVGGGCRTN
jgi:hypothetical protein